jgi:esterase/lipase superfamily enzyme
MMPTPVAVQAQTDDGRDPGAWWSGRSAARFEVLYATDRMPATGRQTMANRYTSVRGITLRFGRATVRFGPEGADPDDVRRRIAGNDRPRKQIVALDEFGEFSRSFPITDERAMAMRDDPDVAAALRAPTDAFVDAINARLGSSRDVLVYVPGFNTDFAGPIQLAADFGYYMKNEVVPVAFSWPARATALGYPKQVTTASTSTRNLRELLRLIAEETNVNRIHVLSFSAGAPIVTDALLQLRLMHDDLPPDRIAETLKLGHVIYASADEDLDRFRSAYLDGISDVCEYITLYSSPHDFGLILSEVLVRGSKRLGRFVENLSAAERQLARDTNRTSIVDVGYAQRRAGGGDTWSHGYWFGNRWVSCDLLAQIRFGLSPGERGLVRDPNSGNAAWTFPRDYPRRIAAIFAERIAAESDGH